jgi:hypothetical protein
LFCGDVTSISTLRELLSDAAALRRLLDLAKFPNNFATGDCLKRMGLHDAPLQGLNELFITLA